MLRQVADGDSVTITTNGTPVAELVPIRGARPGWLEKRDMIDLLDRSAADPGLRDDLGRLAGDTTDDLGPVR